MPRQRGTVRATGIVVGFTIAVVAAAGAFLTISHSRSANQQQRFVVSNYETISVMREAMIVLQDAEVGQRAYLLTGDTANLAPLRACATPHRLGAASARSRDRGRCRRAEPDRGVPRRDEREVPGAQRQHRRLPALWPPDRVAAGNGAPDHRPLAAGRRFLRGGPAPAARARLAMLRSEQEQATSPACWWWVARSFA